MVARRTESPVATAAAMFVPPPVLTLPGGPTNALVVPDVRGLGARDALRSLARLGLTARMRGDGIVVDQTPEPGTPLEPGMLCALELERHPARLLPANGIQP
jgi:hypothetical protein